MRKRAGHRFCRDCGYILDGLPVNRCSECGRPFDPGDPRSYRSGAPRAKSHRHGIWHFALASISVIVILLSFSISQPGDEAFNPGRRLLAWRLANAGLGANFATFTICLAGLISRRHSYGAPFYIATAVSGLITLMYLAVWLSWSI